MVYVNTVVRVQARLGLGEESVALAFAGYIRQGSVPSTVILDAQGRVASTFSGAIPSVRTLVDAVEEAAGDG